MQNKSPYSFSTKKDPATGLLFLTLQYTDPENPLKNITVSVAPDYGSNILEFKVGNTDIFYTDPEIVKEGKWTGCFVLWPLPNRYDLDGKKAFEFEGKIVSLEDIVRKEGNKPLVHGLVDDQRWSYDKPLIDENQVSISTHIEITETSLLYTHFPYKSALTLTFALTSQGFSVSYMVVNHDVMSLPCVFALHPYYRLIDGRENTLVCLPATSVMKANEDLLPTGELISVENTIFDLRQPKPVKNLPFDDVWTDMEAGKYPYVEYQTSKIRITHKTTEDFTHAVLYTQQEEALGFICLEPQTGSTNAINLWTKAQKTHNESLSKAAHCISVPPGKTHTGTITFLVTHL